MCVTAVILRPNARPTMVSNLGDIAKAFGIRLQDIPLCMDVDIDPAEDFCLCVLDAERLGQMTGFTIDPPSWDPDDAFGDSLIFRDSRKPNALSGEASEQPER